MYSLVAGLIRPTRSNKPIRWLATATWHQVVFFKSWLCLKCCLFIWHYMRHTPLQPSGTIHISHVFHRNAWFGLKGALLSVFKWHGVVSKSTCLALESYLLWMLKSLVILVYNGIMKKLPSIFIDKFKLRANNNLFLLSTQSARPDTKCLMEKKRINIYIYILYVLLCVLRRLLISFLSLRPWPER